MLLGLIKPLPDKDITAPSVAKIISSVVDEVLVQSFGGMILTGGKPVPLPL